MTIDFGSKNLDEGRLVAYVINCDCGFVVRAGSEDELVANANAHIEDAHPDMVGKVSREDFLAMAEEQ